MAILVSILGVLATVIGVMGLAQPQRMIAIVEYWDGPTRFRVAVVVRLIFGVTFLVVAPDCRLPIVVHTLGSIAILAAAVILMVGQRRLDLFIGWWLTRRPAVIRMSALFAFALGVLLVYAGA